MLIRALFSRNFSQKLFKFIQGSLALIFMVSLVGMQPLLPGQHTVNAAAGSTRVMCEDDPTLVGCWRMEEGSLATIRDGSPTYLNDGTITGSPTFITGQIGNAFNLSGTGQYAIVADKANLDLTTGMTLAAWVKPGKQGTQIYLKRPLVQPVATDMNFRLQVLDLSLFV